MSDVIRELFELVEKAGLRVTFDPERDITKPCFDCGRGDVPRALIDIGWDERRRDAITRPLCGSCTLKRNLLTNESG